MNEIKLLDKDTIDKIAAGEVVERPASVVKELIENAIDAGATSVSVEIKNGGIDLIRVTDNGKGIEKNQIEKAVLRHTTSKINDAADLSKISTLGFRGEALSSICAVSRLEIMTKTKESITGAIYKAEGGVKVSFEEAGLPDGTTIVARNLFYNVPARLKFLKSAKTEAGYIADIIDKLALSHSDIAFKFINNSDVRLITPGRGVLRDTVFCVFGREISTNLIEINRQAGPLKIEGFLGRPEIARSSRTLENIFINGRYVKDKVVSKAIEDAYQGYQMKGSFPFFCVNIIISPDLIDVNVHPSKLEVKFFDSENVYESIYGAVSEIVSQRENIPEFTIDVPKAASADISAVTLQAPDNSAADANESEETSEPAGIPYKAADEKKNDISKNIPEPFETVRSQQFFSDFKTSYGSSENEKYEQTTLFDNAFISQKAMPKIRIIGQVFNTYWICEYDNKMYIIDQHAAHEKVLYEKFMNRINNGEILSQRISPPIIVSLSALMENTLIKYMDYFNKSGFETEHFGGAEWAVTAVPASLYSSINDKDLFLDTLEELSGLGSSSRPEILLDRVATAACKAAVKGNNALTFKEAQELIQSLLSLENPYNCPHGRPTIITMSKYEMEKKFKRII